MVAALERREHVAVQRAQVIVRGEDVPDPLLIIDLAQREDRIVGIAGIVVSPKEEVGPVGARALVLDELGSHIPKVVRMAPEGFFLPLPLLLRQDVVEPVELVLLLVAPHLVAGYPDSDDLALVPPVFVEGWDPSLVNRHSLLHEPVTCGAIALPGHRVRADGHAALLLCVGPFNRRRGGPSSVLTETQVRLAGLAQGERQRQLLLLVRLEHAPLAGSLVGLQAHLDRRVRAGIHFQPQHLHLAGAVHRDAEEPFAPYVRVVRPRIRLAQVGRSRRKISRYISVQLSGNPSVLGSRRHDESQRHRVALLPGRCEFYLPVFPNLRAIGAVISKGERGRTHICEEGPVRLRPAEFELVGRLGPKDEPGRHRSVVLLAECHANLIGIRLHLPLGKHGGAVPLEAPMPRHEAPFPRRKERRIVDPQKSSNFPLRS